MATKKVLAGSHSRSLQLLCAVGGGQARLDARTEFEIFAALASRGFSVLAGTNGAFGYNR